MLAIFSKGEAYVLKGRVTGTGLSRLFYCTHNSQIVKCIFPKFRMLSAVVLCL
jgi:hypothetical protein